MLNNESKLVLVETALDARKHVCWRAKRGEPGHRDVNAAVIAFLAPHKICHVFGPRDPASYRHTGTRDLQRI